MGCSVNLNASLKKPEIMIKSSNDLLSVLILTRNEELHVRRCIEVATQITNHVYVVDSNSMDKTSEIAQSMGVTVISRDFSKFSDKLNWSLSGIDFPTPWILRLDADEVMSEDDIGGILTALQKVPEAISGVYLRRQLWFMGRWIRHGGMYPTYSMRLLRKGCVRSEQRDLDEHMILLKGESLYLDMDVMDTPLISLSQWVDKHNQYSNLEANTQAGNCSAGDVELITPNLFGGSIARIRWVKKNIFYRMPLFVRPFLYFIYRYVLRRGFLDGKEGFLFHFFHAFWYRMLVDAKIFESRRKS